jgi:SNF2 family DNA or RNA helicase
MGEKISTKKIKPFLIICPATITDNWMSELTTWGYFAASKYTAAEKKNTMNKLKNNRCEIVIVSHEMARNRINDFKDLEWSAIIVDEFHKLKNNKSQISEAFRKFNTKTRIGLSGTILQNNLLELWSLLDWLVEISLFF